MSTVHSDGWVSSVFNGTSAQVRLFSAGKWCENVIKDRKYNQGYIIQ